MEAERNYWLRARVQRRRLLAGSALGGGAIAFAAACGGANNNSAGSKATNPPATVAGTRAATSAAATQAATRPGTPAAAAATSAGPITPAGSLTAAFSDGTTLQLWNPIMWVSGNQTMYRDAVGEPLIAMAANGDKLQYVNALAETVERSPDGLTATFKLRKEAKFHDGSPVTSADVKFSYEFIKTDQAKHARKAEIVAALKSVDTPDASTAVVNLNQPYPLLYTFNVMLPILSKAAFDKGGFDGFEQAPIAAGPFKFVSGTKSQSVALTAVNGHYRKTPYIKDYKIVVVPEEATRVAQIETGEIDIAIVASSSKKSVQGISGARLAVAKANTPLWLVIMDTAVGKTDSPVNDVRVRKALSLAINRKDIVDKLLDGEAVLAGSMSTRYVPGYVELPADDYNLADAKKLLEAAGFPNGFEIDFHVASPPVEYNNVMVADWKKIGITANLQPKDGLALQNMINGHKTPGMYFQGTGANYVDAAQWGLFIFSNGSYSYLKSPDLDAKMMKVANGSDEQQRAAAWGDIQKQIYDDRFYQVVWHQNFLNAVGKKVKEWNPIPGIGYIVGVENAKI